METVMHFFGLCPDHVTHLNVLDYITFFNPSDFYWNIQLVYLHLRIKLGI